MNEILPIGYVPLGRACICLNCEAVFVVGPSCPACAGESFMSLARWMDRPAEAKG